MPVATDEKMRRLCISPTSCTRCSQLTFHLLPCPGIPCALQYLANYASTGKTKVLDTVRQVVALHRERHMFPVRAQKGGARMA